MSTISQTSNKNSSFKSHIVPSVVTAALALSAAIPLTAAFASNASLVSADSPVYTSKAADNTCSDPSATTTSAHTGGGNVMGASTQVVDHYVYPSVSNHGTGNGNGNGNSGQGNGNGNGSGSNANGNTQTATGGLIGGVNAIVPVSALNGSLNGNLSGNTVSVPVLSNNNGNTTSVPVLNNVLNTVTNLL